MYFFQASRNRKVSDSEKSGSDLSEQSEEEDATPAVKKKKTMPTKKAGGRKSPRSAKVGITDSS